jgi:hypothetical protein
MIKHIVIFRLTPPYTSEEKEASVKKLREIFEPMGKSLKFPLEYRTGVNVLNAGHAGDFVIDSLFASEEDLNRYIRSEEHVAAVNAASAVRKTKVTVDYIL